MLSVLPLPLWYLVTDSSSDYPFGIFGIFFFDYGFCYPFGIFSIVLSVLLRLRLLITPLVSFAIVLSVLLRLRLLITPLVSFGHCVVCPSSIDLILITPLVSCGHCVVCPSSITTSDYPFGILWPLCCLFFFDYGF